MKLLNIAVLGATGALGRALVQALEEGDLPVGTLRLLASERSSGGELEFRGEPRRVEVAREGAFQGKDLAFFAAGAAVSRAQAESARAAGCAVIDLSSAFRSDPDVPLVVPQLNPEALAGFSKRRLVAVPGPAAAQLALALGPLHRAAGVERASAVWLHSVSGAGQEGDRGAGDGAARHAGVPGAAAPTTLPHRIAFNLVPQVGPFDESGASEEERDTVDQARRLLGSSLRLSVTAVRVPVFYGHLHALSVKLRRPLSAAEAREVLRKAPGVKVLDAPREGVYAMPMLAVNDDAVLVGRLRADPSQEHGLELLVAGDNLRQGGAATAVGIAKLLAEHHLGRG